LRSQSLDVGFARGAGNEFGRGGLEEDAADVARVGIDAWDRVKVLWGPGLEVDLRSRVVDLENGVAAT
jgi:hypothetical protein